MKYNRVFVIPEAKVGEERKTVVMRTWLGARLAFSSTGNINHMYMVEEYDGVLLHDSVSKLVKDSNVAELESSLEDRFGSSVTKLLPRSY